MRRIVFAIFVALTAFDANLAYASSVGVAAIHFRPELGNVAGNRTRLLALNEHAAKMGAKIIVNTEMATSGYAIFSRADMSRVAEEIPGPTTNALGDIAKRYGVYIAVGMPEFDPLTEQFFNSAAFIGPDGKVIGTCRKRNNLIEASYNAVATGPVPVYETPYGRVAIVICADLFYPHLARLAAVAGADILLAPANTGVEMAFLQQRAKENDISIIVANRYGTEIKGNEVDVFTEDSFSIPSPFAYDFSHGSRSAIVEKNGVPVGGWTDAADHILLGNLSIGAQGTFPVVRRPDLYSVLNQDTLEEYTFRQLGLPKPTIAALVAADPGKSIAEPDKLVPLLDSAVAAAKNEHLSLGLVVFPLGILPNADQRSLDALSVLAKSYSVDLVVSFGNDPLGNRPMSILFAVDAGKVSLHRYVRTHRLPNERFQVGEHFLVVDRPYGRLSILQGPDLLAPETSMVMEKLGVDTIAVAADTSDPSSDTLWRTRAADYVNIVVANRSGDEGVFLGGYPPAPSEIVGEGMALIRSDSALVRSKKEPRHVDVSPLLVQCTSARC
ncbi:nitrilase-related carbon-nitrogen hydrolase [Ensifer aridi]|uniref:nitrilase-related carbon-nitrogen hydrolase n=1 Tax=Ensifer aridi TaxID=1708715 RepID=UPI0004034937|nr:nitrilase-related carbon-nitrogen hydrolase [Ensifer aridi]